MYFVWSFKLGWENDNKSKSNSIPGMHKLNKGSLLKRSNFTHRNIKHLNSHVNIDTHLTVTWSAYDLMTFWFNSTCGLSRSSTRVQYPIWPHSLARIHLHYKGREALFTEGWYIIFIYLIFNILKRGELLPENIQKYKKSNFMHIFCRPIERPHKPNSVAACMVPKHLGPFGNTTVPACILKNLSV